MSDAGVSLESRRPGIKVYVARKTPELLAQIPATIAGHPVAVEETGPFKALER